MNTTPQEIAARVTLSGARPDAHMSRPERWASMLAGGLLMGYGLKRKALPGWMMVLLGHVLLYRGLTGRSPEYIAQRLVASRRRRTVRVHETVIVDKTRVDVYRFWRRLENLPHFMHHLQSVTQVDERRSRWTARPSDDLPPLTWEVELTDEQTDERLAWRAMPDAPIHHAGLVRLHDVEGAARTAVTITLTYRLSAGEAAPAAAALLAPGAQERLRTDLRRFKTVIEAGEAAPSSPAPETITD